MPDRGGGYPKEVERAGSDGVSSKATTRALTTGATTKDKRDKNREACGTGPKQKCMSWRSIVGDSLVFVVVTSWAVSTCRKEMWWNILTG